MDFSSRLCLSLCLCLCVYHCHRPHIIAEGLLFPTLYNMLVGMMKSLKYRSFNDDRLKDLILRKLCAEVREVAEVMRGGKTNCMVGPLRVRQLGVCGHVGPA